MNASDCIKIFQESITDYHRYDDIDAKIQNPYPVNTIEHHLYHKNWIDTVQWHLEDIIRAAAASEEVLLLKKRIDASNQDRTDKVEKIDDWFIEQLKNVIPQAESRLNSETPAWLLDRISILQLKIWHMREQTARTDATEEHRQKCQDKLTILLEQEKDMKICYDELLTELFHGIRRMKVYRQMKMYNDATLNPALYQQK